MDTGFEWFPDIDGEDTVAVVLDSQTGMVLNLDGTRRERVIADGDRSFFKVCGTRSEARQWADDYVSANPRCMCALYDADRKVTYVGCKQDPPLSRGDKVRRWWEFWR